jgi:hypothetical protein
MSRTKEILQLGHLLGYEDHEIENFTLDGVKLENKTLLVLFKDMQRRRSQEDTRHKDPTYIEKRQKHIKIAKGEIKTKMARIDPFTNEFVPPHIYPNQTTTPSDIEARLNRQTPPSVLERIDRRNDRPGPAVREGGKFDHTREDYVRDPNGTGKDTFKLKTKVRPEASFDFSDADRFDVSNSKSYSEYQARMAGSAWILSPKQFAELKTITDGAPKLTPNDFISRLVGKNKEDIRRKINDHIENLNKVKSNLNKVKVAIDSNPDTNYRSRRYNQNHRLPGIMRSNEFVALDAEWTPDNRIASFSMFKFASIPGIGFVRTDSMIGHYLPSEATLKHPNYNLWVKELTGLDAETIQAKRIRQGGVQHLEYDPETQQAIRRFLTNTTIVGQNVGTDLSALLLNFEGMNTTVLQGMNQSKDIRGKLGNTIPLDEILKRSGLQVNGIYDTFFESSKVLGKGSKSEGRNKLDSLFYLNFGCTMESLGLSPHNQSDDAIAVMMIFERQYLGKMPKGFLEDIKGQYGKDIVKTLKKAAHAKGVSQFIGDEEPIIPYGIDIKKLVVDLGGGDVAVGSSTELNSILDVLGSLREVMAHYAASTHTMFEELTGTGGSSVSMWKQLSVLSHAARFEAGSPQEEGILKYFKLPKDNPELLERVQEYRDMRDKQHYSRKYRNELDKYVTGSAEYEYLKGKPEAGVNAEGWHNYQDFKQQMEFERERTYAAKKADMQYGAGSGDILLAAQTPDELKGSLLELAAAAKEAASKIKQMTGAGDAMSGIKPYDFYKLRDVAGGQLNDVQQSLSWLPKPISEFINRESTGFYQQFMSQTEMPLGLAKRILAKDGPAVYSGMLNMPGGKGTFDAVTKGPLAFLSAGAKGYTGQKSTLGAFLSAAGPAALKWGCIGAGTGGLVGGVPGAAFLGGLGALVGGGVTGGIAAFTQYKGNRLEGAMKAVGGDFASRMNMLGGVASPLISVGLMGFNLSLKIVGLSLQVLGGIVKTLAGVFTSVIAGMVGLVRGGWDKMNSLGTPLSTLTRTYGKEAYSYYQQSIMADAYIGAARGTVNSGIENFASITQGFYGMGRFNKDQLINSVMVGQFGNMYGTSEDDAYTRYDTMIESLVERMRNASPSQRQRDMYYVTGLDSDGTIAKIVQSTLDNRSRITKTGVLESAMTPALIKEADENGWWSSKAPTWRQLQDPRSYAAPMHTITDARRDEYRKDQFSFKAFTESIDLYKIEIAGKLWNAFGTQVMNWINGFMRTLATGSIKDVVSYLLEGFTDAWQVVVGPLAIDVLGGISKIISKAITVMATLAHSMVGIVSPIIKTVMQEIGWGLLNVAKVVWDKYNQMIMKILSIRFDPVNLPQVLLGLKPLSSLIYIPGTNMGQATRSANRVDEGPIDKKSAAYTNVFNVLANNGGLKGAVTPRTSAYEQRLSGVPTPAGAPTGVMTPYYSDLLKKYGFNSVISTGLADYKERGLSDWELYNGIAQGLQYKMNATQGMPAADKGVIYQIINKFTNLALKETEKTPVAQFFSNSKILNKDEFIASTNSWLEPAQKLFEDIAHQLIDMTAGSSEQLNQSLTALATRALTYNKTLKDLKTSAEGAASALDDSIVRGTRLATVSWESKLRRFIAEGASNSTQ